MSNYFRKIPDFEYVSRLKDQQGISDYIKVKNLFKRVKIREDIFQELTFFTKYQIIGDDRPDNVAYDFYGNETYDWIVLLSNNIINIQTEWPLTQNSFDRYLFDKYKDYNTLYNGIHHYESREVKNSKGVTMFPAGLNVPANYTFSYYDWWADSQVDVGDISVPVTNYEYEEKIENDKRNIYVLKPSYTNLVMNDIMTELEYKEGSSQFVTRTLKRADNIRLYQ